MSRKGSDFAGLSVAIVTPFKDGKLDVDRLKQQIEFQIEAVEINRRIGRPPAPATGFCRSSDIQ